MKKSIWNYLIIGLNLMMIICIFIPFFEGGCCLVNSAGEVSCTTTYESILARFNNGGIWTILIIVLHMLVAGSGMVMGMVSDLFKGDKRFIISSIALTAVALISYVPIVYFSFWLYGTC